MECRDVAGLLPDYSVGLLKPPQETAVASHLRACAACGREWQALQGVIALVETYAAREPPAGLWNGVYNRITAQRHVAETRPLWRRLWLRPAQLLGSAAAVLALAATLWVAQGQPRFTRVPAEQADRELIAAVREHALASADALFADRTGLESLAALASSEAMDRPPSD